MPESDFAARWSALHQGIDPASVPLLAPLLRAQWRVAAVLVRLRVAPTLITALGVVLAVDAVLLARGYPLVAAACVAASLACDGLDGAVAVVGDRASATGAWADAVADRVADVLFALVIWRCGAPWWLAASAGLLAVATELVRRVRGAAVRGVITVGERPTWAICAMLAAGCAAASDAAWPPTVCASVAAVAGVAALGTVLAAG